MRRCDSLRYGECASFFQVRWRILPRHITIPERFLGARQMKGLCDFVGFDKSSSPAMAMFRQRLTTERTRCVHSHDISRLPLRGFLNGGMRKC